jgi:hypothetical protein
MNWINVNERLPEKPKNNDAKVLVMICGIDTEGEKYVDFCEAWAYSSLNLDVWYGAPSHYFPVMYWQPLPNPPM